MNKNHKFLTTATTLTLAGMIMFSGTAEAKDIKVQKGDTLWSLSLKYKTSVNDFMKVNKMTTTNLFVGQTLTVPVTQTPVEQSSAVQKQVATSGDTLNVRKGPGGITHGIVGNLKDKTVVKVTKTSGDWSYIESGNLKGYVSSKYLKNVTTTRPTKPDTTRRQTLQREPLKHIKL